MDLATVASFFDRTPCRDAYAPTVAPIYGQLNLYDDSARDGTTVVRRVLSLAEGVALPARRALSIHNDVFIAGGVHKDSFDGDVIRNKYVLHRADGLATVKTADQALRALAGATLYAARLWVKDLKELEISSRLASFYTLYVAPTEAIALGSYVQLSSRWHIARNSFLGASGMGVVEVDELPADALTTATYSKRSGQVYDPTTGLTAAASTAAVALLYHRWQDDYVYARMSAMKFEAGDIVANVSKTQVAAAVTGDTFVLNATTYRVMAVRDDGAGAWILHSRPA
jgi:hypothetical protein